MTRYELEEKLQSQLALRSFFESFVTIVIVIGGWFAATRYGDFDPELSALGVGLLALACSIVFAQIRAKRSLGPIKILGQALDHVSETQSSRPAPDLADVKIGNGLLSEMISQIYSLAGRSDALTQATSSGPAATLANNVLDRTPMPLLAMDADQKITYANAAAAHYLQKSVADITGAQFYDALNLWFSTDDTYEKWLNEGVKNTLTATNIWERVKLTLDETTPPRLFDMVASYSKGSAAGFEVLVAIFDRSKHYGHDEQDIAYVAMAVHELRTPITILRGYIEVLNEEFASHASPEVKQFIENMDATAQQLTAFVSNILNIARIDQNQLELKLKEEDWATALESALKDLDLRAKVYNKVITRHIAADLPKVALDRLSIYEVVNNLVDNAIKYGGDSKEIVVSAQLNAEGMVETTVQDFGIGIPESTVGSIFTKLYRSHRSRGHVSGTGLGLYISKKIVNACGGQIWFKTKENEGTVFGFTLKPYQQFIAENNQPGDESREVYGWIKNHSFYKR